MPSGHIDIEKAVLSVLLQYPQKVEEACSLFHFEPDFSPKVNQGKVEPVPIQPCQAFSIPRHQNFFFIFCKVFYEKKGKIDIVSFINEVKQNYSLEMIGGEAYISEIAGFSPSPENFDEHIKELSNYQTRRSLVLLSQKTIKSCEANPVLEEILNEHSTDLDAILDKQITREPVSIEKLKLQTIEHLGKIANQKTLGLKSKFNYLDIKYDPWQKGQVIVLGARPSIGKTSFGINVALSIAESMEKNGIILFFSLEMPNKQLIARVAYVAGRFSSAQLKKKESLDKAAKAVEEISQLPLYFDDSASLTILELKSKAKRMHKRHGLKFIVIDYLQLMRTDRLNDKNYNREREVADISLGIKALSKELDIPILVLAQLNRQSEMVSDKRPQLAQLRESGSIEQDADVVLLLHRCIPDKKRGLENDKQEQFVVNDDGSLQYQLIVAKNRNGETGTLHLSFYKEETRFEETIFYSE